MSTNPKTLTPEQEKAAREAFETRYKGFTWWTEKYGELHPALHKDENGDYLEESQRKYWKGFQEGYAAAVSVPVAARDDAAELRDRIAELERTNFALSEDSALVANENAELTESLKRLLDAVRGTDGHMGLIDMIDGYYGPCLGDAEAAIARAQAALAATEGSESC